MFDVNSIISKGTSLSNNFIMSHLSSGAYHYLLGKIVPTFTAVLRPGISTIPNWQVANNLQLGVEGILENLLNGFGKDLVIRSALSGIKGSTANLGLGFNFQIKGLEQNMYSVMEDVLKLTKKAKEIEVVYGSSSFCRVKYDEKSIFANPFDANSAKITTTDTLNNITEAGITSIRGFA